MFYRYLPGPHIPRPHLCKSILSFCVDRVRTSQATNAVNRRIRGAYLKMHGPVCIPKHVGASLCCTRCPMTGRTPAARSRRITTFAASDNLITDSEPGEPLLAGPSFLRPEATSRACAVASTAALLGFSVMADELPALRLFILTYSVWAMGEWIVHRCSTVSACHDTDSDWWFQGLADPGFELTLL